MHLVKIEKNCDYKDILKGIFTSNERVLDMYNPKELKLLLIGISDKILEIDECVESIQSSLNNIQIDNSMKKEEEYKDVTLEELLEFGEFNLDECVFLKYIWQRRNYYFEYGWKIDDGVNKFKEWIGFDYDLKRDIKDVYENIINHFNILGLLDVSEVTENNNVKLYKLKGQFARELTKLFKEKPNLIEDECSKVPDVMLF